ncbi:RING finger protein 37 isoform X2 [Tachypleus tridentatus]|uniref:RING finger protein 37 isoform X2 n=2 Tax=Tachypleus tridentatus TaxID=6853 RepID=UPI003FD0B5E9
MFFQLKPSYCVMSLNFCKVEYNCHIQCDQVSADGYEVDNLISLDANKRQKGFRAEYFIKPPVNITVTFPVCLEVSHILLGTQVGSQQTTGIEVYSQYSKSNEKDSTDRFDIIGKCFNISNSRLGFYNHYYCPRELVRGTSLPDFSRNSDIFYRFRTKFIGSINSVRRIRLRIMRTLSSTVPALSFLEVWGQPSRGCTKEAVKSFLDLQLKAYNNTKQKSMRLEQSIDCGSGSSAETSKSHSPCKHSVEIAHVPEEFIDPISCEIMSLPVLLPSGHTIDQSTLDKFINVEASWGRLPSDPFTGVVFHKGCTPLPNSALKARLDLFLIKHGDQFTNVGRTVGRGNHIQQPVSDRLQCHSLLNTVSNVRASRLCELTSTGKVIELSQSKLECKRSISPNTHQGRKNCRLELTSVHLDNCSPDVKVENSMCNIQEENNHEERLSQSLNEALQTTLNSLRLRTCPSNASQLSIHISTKHGDCGHCAGTTSVIYRLPCTHVICRMCLTTTANQNICSHCNQPFQPSDVTRVFQ